MRKKTTGSELERETQKSVPLAMELIHSRQLQYTGAVLEQHGEQDQ